MQETIQLICNNKPEEKYYLSLYAINEEFKELLNDFGLLPVVGRNEQ